jgi:hypothetical protein
METGFLRGPPTPFAGHDFEHLIELGIGPDDDGLDQTFRADGIGKFRELIVPEILAGVEAAATELVCANQPLFAFGRPARRSDTRRVAD